MISTDDKWETSDTNAEKIHALEAKIHCMASSKKVAFKQGTKTGKQEGAKSTKGGGDLTKKPTWLKKNTKPTDPKEVRAG